MWIDVNYKLPAIERGIVWSTNVVVWGIDENDEGWFYENISYNYNLKKWGGINGISGNYDEKIKATHWMSEKDFSELITPDTLGND